MKMSSCRAPFVQYTNTYVYFLNFVNKQNVIVIILLIKTATFMNYLRYHRANLLPRPD